MRQWHFDLYQKTSSVAFVPISFTGYAETQFLATIDAQMLTPVPDPILFNETRINPGGHFDTSTGIYTVPLDGVYQFYVNVWGHEDDDFAFYLEVDEIDVAHGRNNGGGGNKNAAISVAVHAQAGQQFWVRPSSLDATYGRTENDDELVSWFSGYLLSAD